MQKNFININKLNEQISQDLDLLIKHDEKYFASQIEELVDTIDSNDIDEKVILIAGPSCAGKTTFAKMLKNRLVEKGYDIINIEMDNFFIDRDKRPRLPSGEEDFESLNIVDLDVLEDCFKRLFKNKTVLFPIYDFKQGISLKDQLEIKLGKKSVIIFEGIHVLNPKLYSRLHTGAMFKIFLENCQGYTSSAGDLDKTQVRFIRRMVRDNERRNFPPRETLKIWDNVQKAAEEYIFPFEKEADFVINTSHPYELGLYKNNIEKLIEEDEGLLSDIPYLKVALEVQNIDETHCPEETLMWEFVEKP